MRALRRAVGRNDVLLAILVFALSGGWFTWHLLGRQALADVSATGSNTALLPSLGRAADLRAQIDAGGNVPDLAGQICQLLAPMVAQPDPLAPDASKAWRQALALQVDANILAAGAGDSAAEAQALTLMRNRCPEDVWNCYFQIPPKAIAATRSGQVDDHARVAMYTAAGFLYIQAGDRIHGDALQRKAIKVYCDLLESYDGWDGPQTETLTPARKRKTVGEEYYTYRNRMQRLVQYSADWWGIRVLRGEVTPKDALSACDYKMFHALVRLRADKDADPITIMRQHRLRPDYMTTLANWLDSHPYEPQAD